MSWSGRGKTGGCRYQPRQSAYEQSRSPSSTTIPGLRDAGTTNAYQVGNPGFADWLVEAVLAGRSSNSAATRAQLGFAISERRSLSEASMKLITGPPAPPQEVAGPAASTA
jgi:hypothetical protein